MPTAYSSSAEHLADELERVELLIRAHLLRRKSAGITSAGVGTPTFPAECQAVLADRFQWDAPVADADCARERDRKLAAEGEREAYIVERLRRTPEARPAANGRQAPPTVRDKLRAWRLTRLFGLIPNLSRVVPAYGKDPPEPAARRDTLLLDIVLLALLADRAPRYRAALAEDGAPPGGLTAEVALRVLQPEAEARDLSWGAFAPTSPLVRDRLVVLTDAEPPARRLVRIDPRIADYLLKKESVDPGLGEPVRVVVEPCKFEDLGLDPAVRDELRRLAAWWWAWYPTLHGRGRFVALFHGPYGSPTLRAAQAFWVGEVAGARQLLAVDVAKAPAGAEWLPFVRRVYREARLGDRAVAWQGVEGLLTDGAAAGRWDALVAEAEAYSLPTFLGSEVGWDPTRAFLDAERFFVRVEFPAPAAEVRRQLWVRRLEREKNPLADPPRTDEGKKARDAALDLLESFQFTEGQIDDAVATARGLALAADPDAPVPNTEQLYEACRRQSARRLVSFAQRVQPRPEHAVPEDQQERALGEAVVLPEASARHLVEMFRRMRHLTAVYHGLGFEHRLALGRGLVALFTGPPGTGKTLAATALAGFLRKDLYKIDMAAVVSKFVGETEKNLSRVFADAQDANAVLFFDEADALFGKRGEVEQAQDRWANLEVNFLLQRVEEYTGTVILASNFRQNIDEAFLRRVQVLIDFPQPNAAARLGILEGMFRGTGVPTPDRETVLRPVAERFELTGGNLKNVVLDAAFRAVAEATEEAPARVTLRQLVLGVAREYQKLGKPITAATFGREWSGWVEEDLKLSRG